MLNYEQFKYPDMKQLNGIQQIPFLPTFYILRIIPLNFRLH